MEFVKKILLDNPVVKEVRSDLMSNLEKSHEVIKSIGRTIPIDNYFQSLNIFMKNIVADSIKLIALGYCCYKTYSTKGEWLETKLHYIYSWTKHFKMKFLK